MVHAEDRERGSVTPEALAMVGVVVFDLVAFSVLFAVVGLSPLTTVLIFVGFALFLVAVAVSVTLAARLEQRTIARERKEWADDLRVWLGGEAPTDWQVLNWRDARRRGLTVEIATKWAERGFTPAVANAAAQSNVSLEQTELLAELMYALGVCERGDVRTLEDVIGWHTDMPSGDMHPVLGRWLAFPLEAIRDHVGQALIDSPHRWSCVSPAHQAMVAAEDALYAMEAAEPRSKVA